MSNHTEYKQRFMNMFSNTKYNQKNKQEALDLFMKISPQANALFGLIEYYELLQQHSDAMEKIDPYMLKIATADTLIREKAEYLEKECNESRSFFGPSQHNAKNLLKVKKCLECISNLIPETHKVLAEIEFYRDKIDNWKHTEKTRQFALKEEEKKKDQELIEVTRDALGVYQKLSTVIEHALKIGEDGHHIFFQDTNYINCKQCNHDLNPLDIDDICWDCRYKNFGKEQNGE